MRAEQKTYMRKITWTQMKYTHRAVHNTTVKNVHTPTFLPKTNKGKTAQRKNRWALPQQHSKKSQTKASVTFHRRRWKGTGGVVVSKMRRAGKTTKRPPLYQKGRPTTGEGSVREDCVEDRAEAREERLTGAYESTTPECPKDREQKPGLEHPSLPPSHTRDRNSI